MATGNRKVHFKAVRMLTAATLFWCISFPLVKGLMLMQSSLPIESSSWFQAALIAFLRFGTAALVLLVCAARTLPRITRVEIEEGGGLGVFTAGGILLQTDGLARTTASVSAFLTQTFCIWVVVIVCFRDRRFPPARVVLAALAVILGVGILNGFRPGGLSLGWGEWETLLGAVFFAGQIVWLERPVFSRNNAYHFSLVMFLTIAVIALPILAATSKGVGDAWVIAQTPSMLASMAALVLFSTLAAFVLMNRWQPYVPATEAAIIYGAEPVLASLMALFIPGLLSRFAGIDYANEVLTWELITGGGVIVLANIYLQANWVTAPASAEESTGP